MTHRVVITAGGTFFSDRMGAMRAWFDQYRTEPQKLEYSDVPNGIMVRLEFRMEHEALAFAERFAGEAS